MIFIKKQIQKINQVLKLKILKLKKIKKKTQTKNLLKKSLLISLLIHFLFFFTFSLNSFLKKSKQEKFLAIQIIKSKKENQDKKNTVNHKKQTQKLKKLPEKIKNKKTNLLKKGHSLKTSKPIEKAFEKKNKTLQSSKSNRSKEPLKLENLKGLKKIEFLEYEKKIREHIHKYWKLPKWLTHKNFKTYVLIVINKKGDIVQKKMTLSSKNEFFDRYVLNIIEKSSPLPPPPYSLRFFLSHGLILQFPK